MSSEKKEFTITNVDELDGIRLMLKVGFKECMSKDPYSKDVLKAYVRIHDLTSTIVTTLKSLHSIDSKDDLIALISNEDETLNESTTEPVHKKSKISHFETKQSSLPLSNSHLVSSTSTFQKKRGRPSKLAHTAHRTENQTAHQTTHQTHQTPQTILNSQMEQMGHISQSTTDHYDSFLPIHQSSESGLIAMTKNGVQVFVNPPKLNSWDYYICPFCEKGPAPGVSHNDCVSEGFACDLEMWKKACGI